MDIPTESVQNVVSTSIVTHLLTVGGFLLAVFAIARLMSEKRPPSNTVAWLLVIVLIPYLGVPLFLLLGGRKLRRIMKRKTRLQPEGAERPHTVSPLTHTATALTITRSGANPPVAGNSVRLLTEGHEAFAVFMDHIRAARHSIHVMTFILGRDETGHALIELLAQRAREGVKVRLLLDAVGCMFSSYGFCDPLREAGGEVVRFLPVLPLASRGTANLRNHRKIAVFDHTTAIVGGHNLARDYMGPTPWKKRFADFGALISGPAAAELDDVFLADWSFAARQPAHQLTREISREPEAYPGTGVMQVVASGPDLAGDTLYEGILAMIQDAESSIWIVTPYFIPDEVLLRSLIVKARAGRDVTLVLPARSNHRITDFARRHYLRQLQRAGARVLLYTPGMLHSKAVIVDGKVGLLGSANFDLRSLFVNFEIGVVLYSPTDVEAMRMWAHSLFEHCKPPAPERRRRERLLGDLAEDISRLLAPLL